MRAAARGEIELRNLDDPKRPPPRRFFPQRQPGRLLLRNDPNANRPVLPDNRVGLVLRRGQLVGRHLARQIDRGHVAPHVETHRLDATGAFECCRQQMLAGVLLHVIDAAGPVDPPGDLRSGLQAAFHHMHHVPVVAILDIEDRETAESPRVERLASGRGIKRGAIEDDLRTLARLAAGADKRLELPKLGVVVIETIRHAPTRPAGSGIPTSAKPRARSTHESHRPHAAPPGPGS